MTGSKSSTVGKYNPIRYRGYVYDTETQLYYLNTRYYNPDMCRFINADSYASTGDELLGSNMFAYCGNNPVVYTDPTGEGRLKELENVLNLFAGGFQVAAGLALGATVGWTGIGAVAAGFLIVDGLAVSLQGAGKIINDVTNSNFLREDNVVRTGVQELGKMVGGETGAIIAGSLYDIAGMAAGLYPVVISLQLAGKLPVRVKVNSLVPNPNNPMTDEGINYWTRTLSQNGFKGYNTLPNAYGVVEPICVQQGTMLITNGHHRVAVLSKYGVEVIKVYFVP